MTVDAQPDASAPDATPTVPTDPAAIATRDQELTQLYEQDPNKYAYAEGGRFANEHLAIRNAQQPKDATQAVDADLIDIEGEAEVAEAEGEAGEEPVETEGRTSPWPERPDSLKDATPEEVEAWREKQGLPSREEYQLPELDEGKDYTDYGKALGEKVVELAYELDMSPAQAQQLILRGDPILKAIAESRDAEDKRTGSKALLDEFGGDRDAAKAHVIDAKAALKELPDGLGKLLLDARGPDGRKLGFNPQFLRWAAQLGANPAATAQPQQDRTAMLQQELAEIDTLMRSDIGTYHRKGWRGGDGFAGDRRLEIMRQLDSPDPNPRQTKALLEDEKRELIRLRDRDPQMFMFGDWRRTGRPAADRLVALQSGRS